MSKNICDAFLRKYLKFPLIANIFPMNKFVIRERELKELLKSTAVCGLSLKSVVKCRYRILRRSSVEFLFIELLTGPEGWVVIDVGFS